MLQACATNLPFPDKYFDFALCIAVLAHLNKDDAFRCLDELERIAYHVIVSAHLGFSSQDELEENLFQKHLSSWHPKDFTHKEYKTRVVPFRPVPRTLMPFYRLRQYILDPTKKHLKAAIIAWK